MTDLATERAKAIAAAKSLQQQRAAAIEATRAVAPPVPDDAIARTGHITSRVQKVFEGFPFIGSYLDEAVGVLGGEEAAEKLRASSAQMDRDHPKQSMALQVGGGLAYTAPLAVAAAPKVAASVAGRSLGAKTLAAAGAGGVAGGVEGAVYGYGLNGDRLANAGRQGMFGTVVGSLLGGAGPLSGQALESALSMIKKTPAAKAAKSLGVSEDAVNAVRAALDADDLGDVTARMRNPDAMLADAGPASAGLLDTALQMGPANAGNRAIAARASAGQQRLTRVLDGLMGKPQGVETSKSAIKSATKALRNTAYNAAYAKPINYAGAGGQGIEDLLTRVPASVINEANALMKVRGEKSAQILFDEATGAFSSLPDVKQIDYITRALRASAMKTDTQGAMGGQTAMGASLAELATDLRRALKGEVPEYARALDLGADTISRTQAVDFGAALLTRKLSMEQVRATINGASKAEIAAMREGVRTQIEEVMSSVQRTVTDANIDAREAMTMVKSLSSRSAQEKIGLLLGDKAPTLFREIDRAATALGLRAATATNSRTAGRLAAKEAVENISGPSALGEIAKGDPVQAAKRLVQTITGSTDAMGQAQKQKLFGEITSLLTKTGGNTPDRLLDILRRVNLGQDVSEAQATYLANAAVMTLAAPANRQGVQLLERNQR